jgi:polyhydroxybutyrate depolymerase
MWRILRRIFLTIVAVVAAGAVLIGYFLYTPAPEVPDLSGTLRPGTIAVGGRERSYLTYVPKGLATGAALVMVMHGSMENGTRARVEAGYGFDRLADAHGFVVAYPDAYEGYWNGCNTVGDFSANKLDIDDVGFLTALADSLAAQYGIDRNRVFAAGTSRGGHMAFRLALEAPQHFRAVAAVSASVPVPENFKCRPAAGGTSSIVIVNGTQDPINPFGGGKVNLFGLFLRRGQVLSARQTGQYFADRNGITGEPDRWVNPVAGGFRVERLLWGGGSNTEVELVAIHGGGHGLPQPYYRHPRLLGPTPTEPNGPAMIWAFFARQRPR